MSQLQYSGVITIITFFIICNIISTSLIVDHVVTMHSDKFNLKFLDLFSRVRKGLRFRNYLNYEGNYESISDPTHEDNVFSLKVLLQVIILPLSSLAIYYILTKILYYFPILNFLPKISDSFY